MTSKYIGSRSSLPKIATFGPARAEKWFFSDKILACSIDCAPKHIFPDSVRAQRSSILFLEKWWHRSTSSLIMLFTWATIFSQELGSEPLKQLFRASRSPLCREFHIQRRRDGMFHSPVFFRITGKWFMFMFMVFWKFVSEKSEMNYWFIIHDRGSEGHFC